MTIQNLSRYVENPDLITREIYQKFTHSEQLTILEYRPDLLELFKDLHPVLTAEDELHLLFNQLITFEESLHKNEFTGDDIVSLLQIDIISNDEFERYRYFEKLTSSHWSEFLSFISCPGDWDKYCNFSDFENEDWVKLLIAHPVYANRCPFEILEPEDLDRLLRHQPELAEISGLHDPVALYLLNSHPYPKDEDCLPFYPKIPKNEQTQKIKIWLRKFFPDITETDFLHLLLSICYEEKTLLGVYNREFAENKLTDCKIALMQLEHFILTVEKLNKRFDI